MKKFITYWCLAVGAVLFVPSIFTAFGSMLFMSDGNFDGASMLWFAIAAFLTSMLTVGMFAFTPAIVVLVIGLVICAMKSSGGTSANP